MRYTPLPVSTLVEIGRGPDGQVPASLLSAAYQASSASHVMLVLNSVSPTEIDSVLDPVVAKHGHMHRGLVYATLQDEAAVLSVAARAVRVFAATDDFRAKLASEGIQFQDLEAAEVALQGEPPQGH
jgi:hypothetical protein